MTPGQQPWPPERIDEWHRLRAAGYTPAQIEALLRPLPQLPAAWKRERDWGLWIVAIVAAVVVLCCLATVILGMANSSSPS